MTMAEPYTPTTDEIVAGMTHLGDNFWRELTEAEVRRGLAAHDREVAARTLRDLGLSSRPYINPILPSQVRRLYDADLRERSIRGVLDLAANLIAGYAVVIARADQIEKEDDRG